MNNEDKQLWLNNPYTPGSNEFSIWEILIKNDFEGYLGKNWAQVEDDYLCDGFFGIDMAKSLFTNNWKLSFPTLESYKLKWIEDSYEFALNEFKCDPRKILFQTTRLENFDFHENSVLVHKVFDSHLSIAENKFIELNWRSLFLLKKLEGHWRIAGFCGYIFEKK